MEMAMEANWKAADYVERYNHLYQPNWDEINRYKEILQLTKKDVIVDFGCGNGEILRHFALSARQVLGVDGSEQQIVEARRALSDVANAECILSPFLECELGNRVFTKGFSRKALHHLTDREKRTFFEKISSHFVEGALFLIVDGILNFSRSELTGKMTDLLTEAADYYGEQWEEKKGDFLNTIHNEYPGDIFTWRSILTETGFDLIESVQKTCFYGFMLCRKLSD